MAVGAELEANGLDEMGEEDGDVRERDAGEGGISYVIPQTNKFW